MSKSKRGICMAKGGITQETPEQLLARIGAKYGVSSNAQPVAPAPTPAPAATMPAATPPTSGTGHGILSLLKNRGAQIDKAANYANGGLINNAAEYWADDNAQFEKTNPGFVDRVVRTVNPMTGFGSAMGAMHTASGNGDIPGMVMAGIGAIPAFGMLRTIPAAGAMKAAAAPSIGKSAAAMAGGAVVNAAADEYQGEKGKGYANGGIVKGKGTPTSDDVPVKINGADYNLSDTEVVLPSKTRQALGEMLGAKPGDVASANALVEKFIEQTNGKPPVQVEEGTNLAAGGLLDDEAIKQNYQNVTGISAPAPIPSPAANAPAGGMSFGQSPAPTIYGNGGLPADVVQRGIETMRGQLAKPAVPASPQSAPATPITSQGGIAARPWYAGTSTMDDRSGLEMERDRRSEASAAGVMNDPVKSALQFGVVGAAQSQAAKPAAAPANASPIAGQTEFKADPFGSTPDKLMAENSDGQFMTGKNGAAPDSSGGGFTQKGVSYNVNPSSQEGITKVTATGKNPLYTNIRPEDATAMLKNQMVGGDAASVQEGLDRYARANAITQSIIDKQPQGGIGILNDPNNVDAANAEKTARWRQDELLQAGKYGNRAAGEAIQANARVAGDQLHSATTQRGQDITSGITARGQDLAAQTAAKQLAVDSPLKDAQAQGILAQTDSARMLADIQKKALAGDAQAAASYRALTGKSAPASDRYMTVQGGEEIGPDGMTKIKRPGGVFDAQTQKFVPMDGGGQPKQQQAPASAVDFLKKNPAQAEAFKAKYGYLPEGM